MCFVGNVTWLSQSYSLCFFSRSLVHVPGTFGYFLMYVSVVCFILSAEKSKVF